jgi:hypothetical protein
MWVCGYVGNQLILRLCVSMDAGVLCVSSCNSTFDLIKNMSTCHGSMLRSFTFFVQLQSH